MYNNNNTKFGSKDFEVYCCVSFYAEVAKYHFKVDSEKLKMYTIIPRANTKINNSHS